jgi:hypothetical protein
VALSTTPDSTRSNAWPARPCQARPRHIPGSIGLRVFRSVPSGAGVCACTEATTIDASSGSDYLLKTGPDSVLGPMGG